MRATKVDWKHELDALVRELAMAQLYEELKEFGISKDRIYIIFEIAQA